jgi:uncharacterized membrane protein YgdD (TMEM256/DUF423 family)
MNPDFRWLGVIGAVSGFLSVALGAFGAHGLKDRVSAYGLGIWNTGAHYQAVHAVAMISVAGLLAVLSARGGDGALVLFSRAGWAFLVGTVIFSGSLYLLALTEIRWLGAITPIGGTAFLIGWALLAYGFFKYGSAA